MLILLHLSSVVFLILTYYAMGNQDTAPPGEGTPGPEEQTKKAPLGDVVNEKLAQLIPSLLDTLGMFKKNRLLLFESLFDPYWKEGHWVYNRTTYKPMKRRPLPPHRTTTTQPTLSTTPQDPDATTSTTKAPYVHLNCQFPCPLLFEDYGEVCGQRFNGIDYEMKQFRDICDLLGENCQDPNFKKKQSWWLFWDTSYHEDPRRGPWRILYRGSCHELTTEFIYSPTNVNLIKGRAQNRSEDVLARIAADAVGTIPPEFLALLTTKKPD